jgi:pimeloyl-ACP methyl ester carboxylesterase
VTVDLLVPAEVPISVRDYGRHPVAFGTADGWDGDVILLPAARGTADSFDAVGGLLRGLGYRPVAVEPRGSGGSGVGPWTWPAVLGDLADVVKAMDLNRPAVIGHGLGGAIAALWGGQHPECPLVVSIDGYGNPTRPSQLGDLEVSPTVLEEFSAFLGQAVAALPTPLAEALRAVEALDVVAVYRAIRCPAVALISQESDLAEILPTELGLVWLAYLDWVRARLAEVAHDLPDLSVLATPGSNDAYLSQPEQLAGLLAEVLPTPGRWASSQAPAPAWSPCR